MRKEYILSALAHARLAGADEDAERSRIVAYELVRRALRGEVEFELLSADRKEVESALGIEWPSDDEIDALAKELEAIYGGKIGRVIEGSSEELTDEESEEAKDG